MPLGACPSSGPTRHRCHEPGGEVWIGAARPPATRCRNAPTRSAPRSTAAGAPSSTPSRTATSALLARPRRRARRVPRARVGRLGGGRPAGRPGPGPRRPVHLPAPRAGRGAEPPCPAATWARTGLLRLRHDDADRRGDLGRGARGRRRRAHGGRPRARPARAAAYACCAPARPPRHAPAPTAAPATSTTPPSPPQRLRAARRRPRSRSSTSTPTTATARRRSSGSDADVLTASVHVDPAAGWFPHFLGFADETGGDGEGEPQRAAARPAPATRLARRPCDAACRLGDASTAPTRSSSRSASTPRPATPRARSRSPPDGFRAAGRVARRARSADRVRAGGRLRSRLASAALVLEVLTGSRRERGG